MVKRITPGTRLPEKVKDNDHGHMVQDIMESIGNVIDRVGTLDLPIEKREIKTHDIFSGAAWTMGSITVDDMIHSKWKDTSIFEKVQVHEQVHINTIFNEVQQSFKVDMQDEEIQKKFKEDYKYIRKEIKNGSMSKDIKGPNGYFIGDRYGHKNSIRIRIPNTAMKKIISISKTRTQRNKLFKEI